MAVAVTVPAAGDAVTEGRIAKWLVAGGASVKADQILYELETDKLTVEVPSPAAGVLTIAVPAGETVAVGATVGSIDPAGKPSAEPAKQNPTADAGRLAKEVVASPAASAMIRDGDLDKSEIAATGPGGRITKDDVLAHQAGKPEAPLVLPAKPQLPVATLVTNPEREKREPMSNIRKRTAERLLQSQSTTATLTTFNEVDMSAIMELRTKYNERFEKKHGVKLGFMSVFVKAAVEALKAFPMVNARIDGSDVVMQNFYDIGVAVSTEKGLFVPVIRDADQMHFAKIEKAIADLAKRAKENKIGLKDLEGGTFTITNGGIFGSMLSTPILNPPQTAILGMHNIIKRAVVVNDEIVIRPMMYLALSYDHRLIDGKEAVQFLVRIKDCVESPERMLLEV
jgi:2-oxoglutarate dehydrogenase E2 component (dihydrolipoamide succinyltransferase)